MKNLVDFKSTKSKTTKKFIYNYLRYIVKKRKIMFISLSCLRQNKMSLKIFFFLSFLTTVSAQLSNIHFCKWLPITCHREEKSNIKKNCSTLLLQSRSNNLSHQIRNSSNQLHWVRHIESVTLSFMWAHNHLMETKKKIGVMATKKLLHTP